ncbi:EI24 domain-containing protein [Sphaerotilus mobilis]|uniref:Etoposide-induced protein 2.4 (EI24) n=1 Tax=Sphaerotilus mobilis TaxID=47994 RepID=A0A4Q7LIC4_9BURK|nr:EI24 domain-containing protein [Sphaerotilus mobilis]RZS53228.1 etoposide-induced protein 2.4 (EI24) [Sphaerotilus mobilis]
MLSVMNAFWRAAAYCLHPRVILLSLVPVVVAGAAAFGLAWFFWEPAIDAVRMWLDGIAWLAPLTGWFNEISGGRFRSVIGPLVVVALSIPVLLIASLLLVSIFMSSAIVDLVARRRFPELARKRGGHWLGSLVGTLFNTLLALLMLIASMPLWLIPPLALVLPPLIWGWLAMRLMSYDALADHASREERVLLMHEHRMPLLAIGLITGYLGAAPSLIWVTGAMALPMMPLLLPGFVWLYTLVFAFASAWFAHYALAALAAMRARSFPEIVPPPAPAPTPANDPTPLPVLATDPPLALPPAAPPTSSPTSTP